MFGGVQCDQAAMPRSSSRAAEGLEGMDGTAAVEALRSVCDGPCAAGLVLC